jgi:hypothetical protein
MLTKVSYILILYLLHQTIRKSKSIVDAIDRFIRTGSVCSNSTKSVLAEPIAIRPKARVAAAKKS